MKIKLDFIPDSNIALKACNMQKYTTIQHYCDNNVFCQSPYNCSGGVMLESYTESCLNSSKIIALTTAMQLAAPPYDQTI